MRSRMSAFGKSRDDADAGQRPLITQSGHLHRPGGFTPEHRPCLIFRGRRALRRSCRCCSLRAAQWGLWRGCMTCPEMLDTAGNASKATAKVACGCADPQVLCFCHNEAPTHCSRENTVREKFLCNFCEIPQAQPIGDRRSPASTWSLGDGGFDLRNADCPARNKIVGIIDDVPVGLMDHIRRVYEARYGRIGELQLRENPGQICRESCGRWWTARFGRGSVVLRKVIRDQLAGVDATSNAHDS